MKECNCGIVRGIENGHNSDCPSYTISERSRKYYEAINNALNKKKNCANCKKPLTHTNSYEFCDIDCEYVWSGT
jgi:hypothetical protein